MNKNAGFTLIEVLIAMVVMAFGLLGLAGLQASSLKNNMSASHRSQATQLAYDIADRMRANVADASLNGGSVYVSDPTSAAQQTTCNVIAGACTPAQMAQQDLFEWNRKIAGGPAVAGPPSLDAVAATLPLGQGTIAVVGTLFTITINWDDNRDGASNAADPNFRMRFQL